MAAVMSATSPPVRRAKVRPVCRRQNKERIAEKQVNHDLFYSGPRVVFLGDSYTAARQASSVRTGWAVELAVREHWQPVLLGISGTGFAATGRCGNDRYATRYDDVIRTHPDAVIIEGGYNDRGTKPSVEEQLVLSGIRRLRMALPGVPVALIGPAVPTASVASQIVPITLALRQAATQTGVTFVDPAGERWFTQENRGRLISADHVHPNDAGYAYMARRVAGPLEGWLSG
ncbi:MAG TPA: SGNH/GDSL hydrolase family protein [Nocardioidaceae bacterium]|nr:SGNH/GDSL hydrolase family protein [Nocardioidaceae bacterium]